MKALVTDCIKLVVITLVAGIALGAVYGITKDPIARQEIKAQQEAYKAVFPDASEFTDVEGFTQEAASAVLAEYPNVIEDHQNDIISAAVEARNASGETLGYIFNVTTPKGYGGNIQLTVGIQADGTVNGYSVLSISETAGLGMNAKTNQAWADQYKNRKVDHFEVVKDGSGNLSNPSEDNPGIDAISGATITSKAVTGAMNSCLAYFQSLEGGK